MKFTLMISGFLLTVISSVCVCIIVRGTEGGQGFMNCPYAKGYENSYKYFYKGTYKDKKLIIKSDGGESSVSEGRFSLRDDHQKRSFTVTIRNLRMTDAGEYCCGVGWGVEYKVIQLNVIRAPQKTRPVQISTSTLHSYTDTSTEHSSTVTPQTESETTTMTGSTAVQLNQPNTSSFVIIITAEALLLLLIGLPLIIVTVWKKKKNKGLLSSSIEEFNSVIYEQIKDAGHRCNPEDRDTETTVVYSCAS